jgi:hypothetical protein
MEPTTHLYLMSSETRLEITSQPHQILPKLPQFTHWSHVTPFALDSPNQFRPGPPPALTSRTYSDDFNEVKSLGIAGGTVATAD